MKVSIRLRHKTYFLFHFGHVKEIAKKQENISISYYFNSRALYEKAQSLSKACQKCAIFTEKVLFLK